MSENRYESASVREVIGTLFSYIYSKKNHNYLKVLGANLLDLITSATNVLAPVYFAEYFDRKINQAYEDPLKPFDIADYYVLGVTGFSVLAQILPKLRDMLMNSVRSNVQKELTLSMVKKVFQVELDHMLNSRTGDFAQILSKNYMTIDKLIPSFSEIFPVVLETLGVSAVLTYRYGKIWLSPLAILTFYFTLAMVQEKAAEKLRKDCVDKNFMAYGAVLGAIENYQVAHQFNQVDFEVEKVDQALVPSEALYRKSHHRNDLISLSLMVVNSLAYLGVLSYLAVIPPHHFKLPDFALVAYLMTRFNASLGRLPNAISTFNTSLVDAEGLVAFLNRESKIREIDRPISLENHEKFKIRFRDVSFRRADRQILEAINFSVKSGQKFAIVGLTGSGKSTLLKLLQRFYPLEDGEGQIFLNGIDVSTLDVKKLRGHIAVVSQDAHLFDGTVKENIQYADLNASDEDVWTSALLAGLITQEDDRMLERKVGQRGSLLSGGEKQRVCIARAILKGGEIYVLDEATSALDPQTESQIQGTLDALTAKCTTFVVTHRLNTVVNADQIICLEHGKVIEQGDFKSLMEKKGFFYQQFVVQCKELGIDPEQINPPPRGSELTEQADTFLKKRILQRRDQGRGQYQGTFFNKDRLFNVDDYAIEVAENDPLIINDEERGAKKGCCVLL